MANLPEAAITAAADIKFCSQTPLAAFEAGWNAAAPALYAKGAAAEQTRIRHELMQRRAVLAYPGSGHLTDAVLLKDIDDVVGST